MRMIPCAISCLILASCAQVEPYLELGVGYTLDQNSDWYLSTERDWTCNSHETFHGEVGGAYKDWSLGYHHQSHISCGGPFNSRPELYQDEIILKYRWQ